MKRSRVTVEQARERGYMAGRRAILRRLLGQVLGDLGHSAKDPKAKLATVVLELEDIRAALRSLCEAYGYTDWTDKTYLADVVDKYLGKRLDEEARKRGEPRR